MISYEKVRQSFRSLNLVIITLESIFTALTFLGLISIIFLKTSGELDTSQMSAEQVAAIQQSTSPFTIFITVVSLALMIAIIVFAARNLSRLKKNSELIYLPYYLGFGLVAINLISTLASGQAFKPAALIGYLIQLAFVALYYFSYSKAKTLNHKPEQASEA
ncbi:hypothetical protein [Streptococcus halichoeri]|uniref:hypothetical protein n=1 Tax=Streptococcus halichoeri TaxID=254785 RepID=UPI0013595A48|nr:hypothetical protein [Streptococcus halichoeri]